MSTRLTPPIGPPDRAQGSPYAPITLVEFGDFACPSCGQAYFVVKALQSALGDRLRFVFRDFPLHPRALLAASAAAAATAQGRFWELHDRLFEHQDGLGLVDLLRHARAVGLDVDRLAEELRRDRHQGRVQADMRSGVLSGVTATPTFFINGERHDGGWDFDSLWTAIAGATSIAAGA